MSKSNYAAKQSQIAESNLEPKAAHLKAIGKLNGEFKLLHSQVLVCSYVQPIRTKGGIFLSDKTLQEDRFQGTLGLVLAFGPGAFLDDHIAKFHGMKPKIHDWVLTRPSDGVELFIREVPCRIFEDVNIKAIVTDPMLYW